MDATAASAPLRVLTVCTMNICRSPAMEVRLREVTATAGVAVEVASGGVNAIPGIERCGISLAHVGKAEGIGFAHSVWDLDPSQFDLIITAQQSHLDALIAQLPQVRDRTFTVVRAAALSQELGGLAQAGDPREFVQALRELDDHQPKPVRSPYAIFEPLDIPDPHVLGTNLHAQAAEMITQSVNALITGQS